MTRYCYLHGTQDCEICAAAKQAEWYCRHGVGKLIAEHKALRAEVERLREAAALWAELEKLGGCTVVLQDIIETLQIADHVAEPGHATEGDYMAFAKAEASLRRLFYAALSAGDSDAPAE